MMKMVRASFLIMLLCYFGSDSILSEHSQSSTSYKSGLALIGARIYPSPTEKPISNGVVLIKNGKITAVGEKAKTRIPHNTTVLDCTGLTLTSGFWNSHVHFLELKWENATTIPSTKLAQQLQVMLTKYGFTAVFDTGSVWANTKAIRERIESGEMAGPRIFSVGEILAAKGGTPPPPVMKRFGFMPDAGVDIGTPEEGVERVRLQLNNGVDAIKIYAATTGLTLVEMPPDVIRAIVAEAHRHGKLAMSHPYNAHGLEASINGGVDVLVHTVPNAGKWDEAVIARMRQNHIALIPTLKLWKVEAAREAMPSEKAEKFFDTGVDQLRAYSQAGGEILFGTDVGYIPDYDPTDEYILMERAGMNFQQILASLTTGPAKRFGLSKRTGRIARGMDADIVLLAGDPAIDIKALSNVRYTLRQGKVIYGAE